MTKTLYRVLVCGGRTYADRQEVFYTLDRLHAQHPFDVVLHGAASGADSLADEWARSRKVARRTFPAQWQKYGKSAGPRRNERMLDEGPSLVVAFPGGTGTAHMVGIAKHAGVRVFEYQPPEETTS